MSRSKCRGMAAADLSQRQLRMGELLRHALAEVVAHSDFRNTVLANAQITVTEVRPSSDLKNATVFIATLGDGNTAEVASALTKAKGFLRSQIGSMLEAKFTPDLSFKQDASFAAADRIAMLLAKERA